MMQTWYGPTENDTLRYSQRIGFLASSFEEAAELAQQYYRPILLGIEQRYTGRANAEEYPIEIIEYSPDMAPSRSDSSDDIPDIEWVASDLIAKNPSVYTVLLEQGSDVQEFVWSHAKEISSKLIQDHIGVVSSRRQLED
jgi:hypothetical protein